MDPEGDGTVSKEKGGREEKKCVCMEVQRRDGTSEYRLELWNLCFSVSF